MFTHFYFNLTTNVTFIVGIYFLVLLLVVCSNEENSRSHCSFLTVTLMCG